MPDRGIVHGILFVFTIALLVMLVELFLPVSAKIEMNMDCRKSLLKMEVEGGLSAVEKDALKDRLIQSGMTNIVITGSNRVRQGDLLNLRVESDYVYSKFINLFFRENVTQHMVYNKTSISRRVVN